MNRQDKLLNSIAEKYNISFAKAEYIWKDYCLTVKSVITDPNNKDEQGLYIMENLKTIKMIGLGKFYPKPGGVKFLNKKKQNRIDAGKLRK